MYRNRFFEFSINILQQLESEAAMVSQTDSHWPVNTGAKKTSIMAVYLSTFR